MTTRTKQARNQKTTRQSRGTSRAVELLKRDHKAVDDLFRRYEELDDGDEKADVLATICAALTAHAILEEEIFYPELRSAFAKEDAATLDEAVVEHASIRSLVEELEGAEPGEALVDAKVKVLAEYVRHHVKEEEGEMFPQAKRLKGLDLDALGERMATRLNELHDELGLVDEDEDAAEDEAGTERRKRGKQ